MVQYTRMPRHAAGRVDQPRNWKQTWADSHAGAEDSSSGRAARGEPAAPHHHSGLHLIPGRDGQYRHLLHLQRAGWLLRARGRHLHQGIPGPLQRPTGPAAVGRRRPAPAARPAARRPRPQHRHPGHGRGVGAGVRGGGLDQARPRRYQGTGDQRRHPARCPQDRHLEGHPLRAALQLEHAAPLVPQGPRADAAGDLGPDDQRGSGPAPAGKAGADRGAGGAVRGPPGVVKQPRGLRRRQDPGRQRQRGGRRHEPCGGRHHAPPRHLARRRPVALQHDGGPGPPGVRVRQGGVRGELPARLSLRREGQPGPGEGHGLGTLAVGDPEHAQPRHHRRDQPRRQRLLPARGPRLPGSRLPAGRRQPEVRGRQGRSAPHDRVALRRSDAAPVLSVRRRHPRVAPQREHPAPHPRLHQRLARDPEPAVAAEPHRPAEGPTPAADPAARRHRIPGAGGLVAAGTDVLNPPAPARRRGKATRRARDERRLAYMLCAPAVVVMLAVTAYPILYAVWLSLRRADLRFPAQSAFVGLANYITVLRSGLWWQAVANTVIITVVSVAIELVFGMAIALVMHRALIGRTAVRTAALIPYGIITVVAAFSWRFAWTPSLGYLPRWVHLNGDPLTAHASSLAIIILAEVWKTTPFMSLLLLAGLALVSNA